jgi:hypothetical protein
MKTKILNQIVNFFFAIIMSAGLSPIFAQTLLFKTDFAPPVVLQTPCANNYCRWQEIQGNNAISGGTLWGATNFGLNTIAAGSVTSATINDYVTNEIQQVTGPKGTQVYALFQNLKINNAAGPTWGVSQDPLMILRNNIGGGTQTTDIGDIYYTYWFKFQPDLAASLGTDGNTAWRVMSEFKTNPPGSYDNGDFRIITYVFKNTSTGQLYWVNKSDNKAGTSLSTCKSCWGAITNTTVPVPVGQWFKYEVFLHRSSGSDGRYWAAVNGQVIVDHNGPNMGDNNDPIDRIFLNNNYGGGAAPQQQWVTGLEIWDGWPCGVGVSCYSKPAGLAEIDNRKIYYIYPNPFNTSFTLQISNATILKKAVMKIYDVCSKEVKTVSISSNETTIERGELQSGIYSYSIINNNEKIMNGKLVVQ